MAEGLHEYDLGDLIGSGSSAQVYWAHRLSDGELVAMKVLDKLQHAQIRMQSRSMSQSNEIQEIQIQRRLSHPNVLKILDVFEDARNAFIVLEPCLGGSLQTITKKDDSRIVLDETRARHIIKQLASGVAYIHAHEIIHRDLKLSNILLTDTNIVKIADFGLATDLTTNETPHTICGTPNFIAPEVILGKPYSQAADLWSLGCITYSLLVGKPPFQGQNITETLKKVGSNEPIYVPTSLSSQAVDFLKSLLTVEPSHRLSCGELALHPWLQPLPRRGVPVHRPKPKSRRAKFHLAPRSVRIESSDESAKSATSSGEDQDIAQLQTMLDKIANPTQDVPNPQPDSVEPPPVETRASPPPPVSSFVVEFKGILGATENSQSLICKSTGTSLELEGPNGERIEYLLAQGVIQGDLSPSVHFDCDFSNMPLLNLQPRVVTWMRVAQWCLAQSPVRTDRLELPQHMIESLQRLEELPSCLRKEQTESKPQSVEPPMKHSTPPVATAELAGIGRAESLEDGTLSLYFLDGAVLQVDDCASSVSYLPKDADEFDVFPLNSVAHEHMPYEVSRRLKYVSLFIQEMKKNNGVRSSTVQ
ncbi:unnamed protein product [Aphanomyces euteiches]|nr:hypothetical protein AeRB84_014672 [Aphanomyces euteiches]